MWRGGREGVRSGAWINVLKNRLNSLDKSWSSPVTLSMARDGLQASPHILCIVLVQLSRSSNFFCSRLWPLVLEFMLNFPLLLSVSWYCYWRNTSPSGSAQCSPLRSWDRLWCSGSGYWCRLHESCWDCLPVCGLETISKPLTSLFSLHFHNLLLCRGRGPQVYASLTLT